MFRVSFFLVIVAILAVVAVWCFSGVDDGSVPKAAKVEDSGPRFTRGEFAEWAIGRDWIEIQRDLRHPARFAHEGGPGVKAWGYNRLTVDPATGAVDEVAWVWFDADGRAVAISYGEP